MSLLLAIYALCVFVDGVVTDYRLHRHGLRVELNPVVRFFVKHLGNVSGLALGIAVPAVGLAYLAYLWGIVPLAFLAGMRTMWMWKQLMALRLSGV